MPYEGEESSLLASSKFINENLQNDFLTLLEGKSTFIENKILQFINTLTKDYVDKIPHNPHYSDSFHSLYAIDGSIIDLKKNYGEEERIQYGIQVGAAYLDIHSLNSQLLSPKGNVDPSLINKIYSHVNNFSLSGLIPGKNMFYYENDNNNIKSLQNSFVDFVEELFKKSAINQELYEHITQHYFLLDNFIDCQQQQCHLKKQQSKDISLKCQQCQARPVDKINFIKRLKNEIDSESVFADTKKQSKDLMLILENFLVTYIIEKNKNNPNNLAIILDGRLQNQYINISQYLEKNRGNNEYKNIFLIGVQKTGLLNHYLSAFHRVIKDNPTLASNPLLEPYYNKHGLYLFMRDSIKTKAGLPKNHNSHIGYELLVITPEPYRREFVLSIPKSTYWKIPPIEMIAHLLEKTQSDLYYQNKGVLISNILAHHNVSLNKNQTNRINQINNEQDTSMSKNKI